MSALHSVLGDAASSHLKRHAGKYFGGFLVTVAKGEQAHVGES